MPASYNIVDSKIMEMKPFTKSNYNTGHFWSRRPDNIYKKEIYTAVIKNDLLPYKWWLKKSTY